MSETQGQGGIVNRPHPRVSRRHPTPCGRWPALRWYLTTTPPAGMRDPRGSGDHRKGGKANCRTGRRLEAAYLKRLCSRRRKSLRCPDVLVTSVIYAFPSALESSRKTNFNR